MLAGETSAGAAVVGGCCVVVGFGGPVVLAGVCVGVMWLGSLVSSPRWTADLAGRAGVLGASSASDILRVICCTDVQANAGVLDTLIIIGSWRMCHMINEDYLHVGCHPCVKMCK